MQLPFDNSYAQLPAEFYSRLAPTPVKSPTLLHLNHALAEQLGINTTQLSSPDGIAVLAGNAVPEGADPLAAVYAGHPFGHWNPQLGDGRAILLGEILDRDNKRFDIQLKGAGPTPYSRNGDGRAAIGPVLREYVVSEAMHALGVPTTRALAAVSTGETVRRETFLPGAIITRVAQSHIRVGTFQYFISKGNVEAVKALCEHVILRHYPEIAAENNKPLALLKVVVDRQALLVAHWQSFGFIHGVMNTDNCSIAGDTIDYGPCAFMDNYDPATVFSSIDHGARYAYQNQPGIAQWNMANFAQCLLPLIDEDDEQAIKQAQAVIDGYPEVFSRYYRERFGRKLGLAQTNLDDGELIESFLTLLKENKLDFTNTFRALCELPVHESDTQQDAKFKTQFESEDSIQVWLALWRQRHSHNAATQQSATADANNLMRSANPAYIPRNHRIEQMILAAEQGDLAPMNRLIKILADPYAEQANANDLMQPPEPNEVVQATFCGT